VLRHLLSILLLPFMVVVIVPYWLLNAFPGCNAGWSEGMLVVWAVRFGGAAVALVGLALFGWCVGLFARVGQGTLAPWDPTCNLVAVGPYRFVRNPMISGVALMLIGLALLWGSLAVGIWAGIFICINHIYFVVSEEPGLEKRFGENYRLYKAKVPRWIPRTRS
jgi:protein-S-isoprenylcysteine O-methyltransferase Ste14